MNRRIGRISRIFTPHMTACRRCKTTWRFVTPHATPLNDHEGMFPLCQKCWSEMTPEQRLAYYWQVFAEWASEGCRVSGEERATVRANVLAGL